LTTRRIHEVDSAGAQAVRAYLDRFRNETPAAFRAAAKLTDEAR
jgi:hypothetical protein